MSSSETASTLTTNSNVLNYSDQAIKRICVCNRLQQVSLTDNEIMAGLRAIQDGLKREFLFYHGFSAKIYYAGPKVQEQPNMWNMYLLDTSDVAGALGYHDNNDQGIPQGKIFVKTVKDYNASWTVTLDHEIKEALCDPWGMDAYFDSTNQYDRLIAWEVGDPVEADMYGYTNNGVLLSNFATPYWKHPFNDTAELDDKIRYDARGLLKSGFSTMPGCHQSYYYMRGGPNGQMGWVDKNFRKPGTEIEPLKFDNLGKELLEGTLTIYSPAQHQSNWHIAFQTPDPALVEKHGITVEEVKEAIHSAFNPAPGSRRDIRFKMSEFGPNALVVNESQKAADKLNLTQDSSNVFAIDNSFDEIVEQQKN